MRNPGLMDMSTSIGCSFAPTNIPGIQPDHHFRDTLCGPQKRRRSLHLCSSIRRVRRAPPIQRCATIAPSEFNFDDINSFGGKITDFNYRFLGRSKMLGNFAQEQVPFYRKSGDYLPLKESWEIVEAYGLEITPKDPSYCYPRKVIYFDVQTFETFWTMIWDAKGSYWKEQFAFRSPVTLPDGQLARLCGDRGYCQCAKRPEHPGRRCQKLQSRLSTKPLYPCDAADSNAGRCYPMKGSYR